MFKEWWARLKTSILLNTSLILFSWKLCLIVGVLLAARFFPFHPLYVNHRFSHDYQYWIKVWANFDGFQYLRVAKEGYNPDNLPFFPFYPATIAGLHSGFRLPYLVSALSISHLSLFISLSFFLSFT